MKFKFATVWLMFLWAFAANAQRTIDIGTVPLKADTPDQSFVITVSGGGETAGMNFYLQIGGGTSGPVVSGVDMINGTIWNTTSDKLVPLGGAGARTIFYGVVTPSGTTQAEGAVATVTLDTSGIPGGDYPVTMVYGAYPSRILDANGDSLSLELVDGQLRVPYVLTYEAGEGGGFTGTTMQEVYYNQDGTAVSAVPNDGYRFVDWSDGRLDNPRTDTNVTADINVTANFEKTKSNHTLTVENGDGDGVYAEFAEVEISADAAPEDYEFDVWQVDPEDYVTNLEDESSSTTNFVMPAANVTVTATFKKISKYKLTLVNGDGGGEYFMGQAVSISAVASAQGEEFAYWAISPAIYAANLADANSAETTLTMPAADITATAVYRTVPKVKLTIDVQPAGGGQSNPTSGDYDVTPGETISVLAAAAEGYRFLNWQVIAGSANIAAADSFSTTVTPNSDATVVANFTKKEDSALALTYPNGHETFRPGESNTIRWCSNDLTGEVKIELYRDEVLDSLIAANTANSGAYDWQVPEGQTAGNYYKIRVSSLVNPSINDDSDQYFAITGDSYLVLTSPNGGENFEFGGTCPISWESEGVTGGIRLELYLDNAYVTSIATVENNGAYTWTVPEDLEASRNYRIMVWSDANNSLHDVSDADFTISESSTATLTMVTLPDDKGSAATSSGKGGRDYVDASRGRSYNTGEAFAIKASPVDGYSFVYWKVEGNASVADKTAAETSAILCGDAKLTAIFSLDHEIDLGKMMIKLNDTKADSDTVMINMAELPNDIVSGEDFSSDNFSLQLLIDDYQLVLDNDSGVLKQKGSKDIWSYKASDGAKVKLILSLDEKKRFWSVRVSKINLGGLLSNLDGINVYLGIGSKLFGASVDMDKSTRWKYAAGAHQSSELSVPGIPLPDFDIVKADGKHVNAQLKKDSFSVKKAKVGEVADFDADTKVIIGIDDWRETLSSFKRSGKKRMWNFKGAGSSGEKIFMSLDFDKRQWKFKVSKVSFANYINGKDGIDIILRIGNYESGLRLGADQITILKYPRK